jgi:hypothetical protein
VAETLAVGVVLAVAELAATMYPSYQSDQWFLGAGR